MKRVTRFFQAGIGLVMLLVCVNVNATNEFANDTIYGGGSWLSDTVFVNDTVVVVGDLTIASNTAVLFDENCFIKVQGYINAVGSVADSIIFKPADDNGSGVWGGIRFLEGSYAMPSTFEFCEFHNATTDDNQQRGGALTINNHSLITIENCLFKQNSAQDVGGAIYGDNSDIVLRNNMFTQNGANDGVGIYLSNNSSAKIIQNIFVNNDGNPISCHGSNKTIEIYSNTVANNSGHPIFIGDTYEILIKGNIFAGNGNNLWFGNDQNVEIMYNCNDHGFWQFNENEISNPVLHNNIQKNPQFVSPTGGQGSGEDGSAPGIDWHLNTGSYCINAGIPDTVGLLIPLNDFNGDERIYISGNYQRIDIGAYELQDFATAPQLVFDVDFNDNMNNEGHLGSSIGSPFTTPNYVSSRFNSKNAFEFDGVSQDVNFTGGISSLRGTDQFTISFWMNPYEIVTDSVYMILSERNNGDNWEVTFANNQIAFSYWVSGVQQFFETDPAFYANAWQQVTITYNGSDLNFYRNGGHINHFGTSGVIDNNNCDLVIGSNSQIDHYFKGALSDIKIYNGVIPDHDFDMVEENFGIKGEPRKNNSPLTFQANMAYQIQNASFDPETDMLEIVGDWNGWMGMEMQDPDSNGIYEITIGNQGIGNFYTFRFQINGGQENLSENRAVTVENTAITYYGCYDDMCLNNDVAPVAFIAPENGILSASEFVTIEIQNMGISVLDTTYAVSYEGNGGWVYDTTPKVMLYPGETYQHIFTSTPEDLSTPGIYDYTFTAQVTHGDDYAGNDTAKAQVVHIFTYNTLPVIDDFESVNNWTVDGINSSWEIGDPSGSGFSSAPSGSNAWVTNPSGNFNSYEENYLYSPYYDITTYTQIGIRFKSARRMPSDAELYIQMRNTGGGEWKNLKENNDVYAFHQYSWWSGNSNCNVFSGNFPEWRESMFYIGDTTGVLQFRFVFKSDINTDAGFAFDDFEVLEWPEFLPHIINVNPKNSPWLSTGSQIQVNLKNLGYNSISTLEVFTDSDTTYHGPFDSFTDLEAWQPTNFDFTFDGETHFANIWAVGSGIASSDTIAHSFRKLKTVTSYPYFENFESQMHVDSAWFALNDVYESPATFEYLNDGGQAYSGTYFYGTGINQPLPFNRGMFLESPAFDFSGINPVISFKAKRNITDNENRISIFYTVNGNEWHPVEVTENQNWPNQTNWVGFMGMEAPCWTNIQDNDWVDCWAKVPSLTDTTVQFRFVVETGSNWQADQGLLIDDFKVESASPIDLTVTNLVNPKSGIELTTSQIEVEITNKGTSTSTSSFDVVYSLNGGSIITETLTTPTINPGNTYVHTFTPSEDISAYQEYNVKVWISTSFDAFKSNDTVEFKVSNAQLIATFPYMQDFEGAHGWYPADTSSIWQVGTPDGSNINSAYEGNNALFTQLANQPNNTVAILESPFFDLSAITNPVIAAHIWKHPIHDGNLAATLQVSLDSGANWQTYGEVDENFYDGYWGPLDMVSDQRGWSNSSPNNWYEYKRATYDNNVNIANTANIKLRFVFATYMNIDPSIDGFAIDNFKVYDGSHDLRVKTVDYPANNILNDSENITVTIRNNGQNSESNFYVYYSINGALPDSSLCDQILNPGEEIQFTSTSTFSFAGFGKYNIKAWTALETDGNRYSDTAFIDDIYRFDELTAHLPFATDAVDISGNGFDGDVHGCQFIESSIEIGDNDTDYVVIPSSTMNNLNDFTIEAVVKLNAIHHDTIAYSCNTLFSGSTQENPDYLSFFYWHDSHQWVLSLNGSWDWFTGGNFGDNMWHHIALVRENNMVRLYVDSIEVKNIYSGNSELRHYNDAPINIDPQGLIVGQRQSSVGGGFDQVRSLAGQIQDFKVWNKAGTYVLPPDTVYVNFVANSPQIDGSIDALWATVDQMDLMNFTQNAGTPASDISAYYKTVWDSDSLYILVDVTDDHVEYFEAVADWETDNIEIFFDFGNERNTTYDGNDVQMRIIWGVEGVGGNIDGLSGDGSEINYKQVLKADGYITEIAMPWSVMHNMVPSPYAEMGFDISVADCDDGAGRETNIYWNTTSVDQNWNNPQDNGVMKYNFNYLQVHYPLDGNGDELNMGLNGALNNVSSTTDRFGNDSSAVHFTGTSSYIDIATNTNLINDAGAFSIVAWVNPVSLTSQGSNIQQTILAESEGGDNYRMGIIDNAIHFQIWEGASPAQFISDYNTIQADAWQMLTITYNGDSLCMYRNTQLVNSFITTFNIDNNASMLRMGSTSVNTDAFSGDMDNVLIYNRALTPEEIFNMTFKNGYNPDLNVTQTDFVLATPIIDGATETFWDTIPSQPITNELGNVDNAADLSANYKTTFDNEYLYLLVEVTDDNLNMVEGIDGDNVEVYIDMNNGKSNGYDGDDFQYRFNLGFTEVTGNNMNTTPPYKENFPFAQQTLSATEYVMEIAIPWEALNNSMVPSNREIGFDIIVNDNDNGSTIDGRLSWSAVTYQGPQSSLWFGNLNCFDSYYKAYYAISGNADDHSGNDLHGTPNQINLDNNRLGWGDEAFRFDSVNSYINIGNNLNLINGSTPFSISAWINPSELMPEGTNKFYSIISERDGGDNYQFGIKDNAPCFIYWNGSNPDTITADYGHIMQDNWQLLTVVNTGSEIKFFHNTNEINVFVIPINIDANPANTYIGCPAGETFKGLLDDIRIYSRTLNNKEIADFYYEHDYDIYNDITLQVDMSYFITVGLFNEAVHSVELMGSWNQWSEQHAMNNIGNGIYEIEMGGMRKNMEHQFRFITNGSWDYIVDGDQNRSMVIPDHKDTLLYCMDEHCVHFFYENVPGSRFNIAFDPVFNSMVDTVHWDFGDGNTSNEFNPTNTYAGYGNYTVTVSVANYDSTFMTSYTDSVYIYHLDGTAYYQDYEADVYWHGNTLNGKFTWQMGIPNSGAINSDNSDGFVYANNLRGPYSGPELSFIQSPWLDISALVEPIVSFDIFGEIDDWDDGLLLQYTTDTAKNWITLGSNGSGNEWYNWTSDASQGGLATEGEFDYWTGMYGDWRTASHDLSEIQGAEFVSFRFLFGSDTTDNDWEGFAIDNFEIGEAPKPDTALVNYTKYGMPVIDGASETFWDTIPQYNIQKFLWGDTDAADLSAFYKIAYDNEYLYVILDVTDDNLMYDEGLQPWQNDMVQIFFDTRNERNNGYDENDGYLIYNWSQPDAVLTSEFFNNKDNDIVFAQQDKAGGYIMEFAFPWYVLDNAVPLPYSLMGFDMFVGDNDGGGGDETRLIWNEYGPGDNYQDPSVNGVLEFGYNYLQAYYPLDNGMAVELENGINGTVNGLSSSSNRFGQTDSALYFFGAASYIDVSTGLDLINTSDEFSIVAWVQPDAVYTIEDSLQIIIGESGANSNFHFGIFNDAIQFTAYEGGTPYDFTDPTGVVMANNWQMLSVTYNGDSIMLYQNATMVHNVVTTFTLDNFASTLRMGSFDGTVNNFAGNMDEVLIYNRALSETEIYELAFKNGFKPTVNNDLEAFDIVQPQIGCSMSSSETVTVKIVNNGVLSATGFDIEYIVDGQSLITETYVSILNPGDSTDYSFSAPVDLSVYEGIFKCEFNIHYTNDEYNPDNNYSSDVRFIRPVNLPDGWQAFTTCDDLPTNAFNCVTSDQAGNVWIGTELGLSMWDGTKFNNFDTTNSIIDRSIRSVFVDQFDNIWAGGFGVIYQYDGSSWEQFDDYNSAITQQVTDIIEDDKGDIWISVDNGEGIHVLNMSDTSWVVYNSGNTTMQSDNILALYRDKIDNIWIGAWGGGATKFDGSTWVTYHRDNSDMPGMNVFDITEDSVGNMWYATAWGDDRSLLRFDGTNWFEYNGDNLPFNAEPFKSVYTDSLGNIWAGSWSNGILKFDGNQWIQYEGTRGLSITSDQQTPGSSYSFAQDNLGALWIPTSNGLFRKENAEIEILDVFVQDESCGGAPGSISINAIGNEGTDVLEYQLDAGSFLATNEYTGLAAGDYTITVRDQALNTLSTGIISVGSESVLSTPYFEDFETGENGWYSFADTTPNSWEFGTPAGNNINFAASGDNAWMTWLNPEFNDGELSYLYSPCFDFTNITTPIIGMQVWAQVDDWDDGLLIQYSIDDGTNWITIGDANGHFENWYNHYSGPMPYGIPQLNTDELEYLSGNTPSWVKAYYPVYELAGESLVKFRYVFGSDQDDNFSDGFAIDDFEIYSAAEELTENFNDNILTNWGGSPMYTLNEVNQELHVAADKTDWDGFSFEFEPISVTNNPYVSLMIKSDTSINIRPNLRDTAWVITDSHPGIWLADDGLYHNYFIDLTDYLRRWDGTPINDSMIVGMEFQINRNYDFVGDLYFDSLRIGADATMNENIVLDSIGIGDRCSNLATTPIIFKLKNTGVSSLSSFNLTLMVDGVVEATDTYSGTILPGDSAYHTFATTANLYHNEFGKSFFIKGIVENVLDENYADNTKAFNWFVYGDHTDKPNWTSYSTCDGLADYRIYSIDEDINGDIWIGGVTGVTRFDGSNLTQYHTEDGLLDNYVWAMQAASDGKVWMPFGMDNLGGFNYWDGSSFITINPYDTAGFVECAFEDEVGNMWFGSWQGDGVAKFDGTTWTQYQTEFGTIIEDIDHAPNGDMLFADYNNKQVIRWNGTTATPLLMPDTTRYVNEIFRTSSGTHTWFYGLGILTQYNGTNFTNFNNIYDSIGSINAIEDDVYGNVWFGGTNGVAMYDGATWNIFDANDGLLDYATYAIVGARDGKVWFGTGSGVSVYNPGPKAQFTYSISNDSVFFTNQSIGDIVSYMYVFGDGDTAYVADTVHVYPANGTYDISLKVVDSEGYEDISYNMVVIENASAICDASFTHTVKNDSVFFTNTSSANIETFNWDFGDGTTSSEQHPIYVYDSTKNYSVSLTVTDSSATCTQVFVDTVEVDIVSCEALFSQVISNDSVVFTNLSSANIDTYVWNFGDGITSIERNPTHVYSTTGTFIVTLNVTDSTGLCSSQLTDTVIISNIPVDCNAQFSHVISNDSVVFTNLSSANVTSYTWNFGDGGSSVETNPLHVYDSIGSFIVSLVVTDSTGTCTSSITDTVIITSKPVICQAQFSFVSVNDTVFFANLSSLNIESFNWNFGDDSISTALNPIHIYSSTGWYNVSLTVVDSTGSCTSTFTDSVYYEKYKLNAMFDYLVNTDTVEFINLSDTSAIEYLWSFGNGKSSALKNPVHVYNEPGEYFVCLNAKDAKGNSADYCQAIEVLGDTNQLVCLAKFDYTLNGDTLIVTNRSSENINKLYWDFGDNAYGNDTMITHIYTEGGYYDITLTAFDTIGGCSNSITKSIFIEGGSTCNADFVYSDNFLEVDFSNVSQGSANIYYWDFGDGVHSADSSPNHVYVSAGQYDVCLTIYNDTSDCFDKVCNSIVVQADSSPVCFADFSFIVDKATVSFVGNSQGNIHNYFWQFDDDSTSNIMNPTHTYLQSGFYDVSLTVIDTLTKCLDKKQKKVFVLVPEDTTIACQADFGFVINGDTVTFNNTSVSDNAVYFWDFDNGKTDIVKNPVQIFDAGYYKVCLSIHDTVTNCISETCETIFIEGEVPVCNVNFEYFALNNKVNFVSTVSKGITNYFWSFGDDNFSTDKDPEHTYAEAGYYEVVLKVKNEASGCFDEFSEVVFVDIAGVVSCKADFTKFVNKTTVSFTNISEGTYTNVFWNFGDGIFSQELDPSHTYSRPDYYNVCITVYDSVSGCMDEICKVIPVLEEATASCNASYDYFAKGLEVNFDGKVLGDVTKYLWDFGDGEFGYDSVMSHTYQNSGFYEVSFTVLNENTDCLDKFTDVVYVFDSTTTACNAMFTAFTDQRKVSFVNTSKGKVTDYFWNFGDGYFSTDTSVTHTYEEPGLYEVELTIYNSNTNCIDTYNEFIMVIDTSKTSCQAMFSSFTQGKKVSFANESLGTFTDIFWDFGNGDYSTDTIASHTYSESGYYEVILTVYNSNNNCFDEYSEVIAVIDTSVSICKAEFTYYTIGDTVKFASEATGEFKNHFWSFDDGTTSNEISPIHVYEKPGYYEVNYSVIDTTEGGCFDSRTQVVFVQGTEGTVTVDNIKARYSSMPNGLNVTFSDKSVGNVTNWYWDFGDESVANVEQHPKYSYATNDYYRVCLTASNSVNQATKCKFIAVGDVTNSSQAYFTYFADSVTSTGHFRDKSLGNITAWHWDFGDDYTSNKKNPSHTYASIGKYVVSLTTTSASGEKDTWYENVWIGNAIENPCLISCVWPGDANNDTEANHYDVMTIGLNYNLEGPKREDATIGWYGQFAQSWSTYQLDGTNNKYGDCNGDGVINRDDIEAIQQNFAYSHYEQPDVKNADWELTCVWVDEGSKRAGSRARARAQLAPPTKKAAGNIYAIGFEIEVIGGEKMLWDSLEVDFSNSWINADGTDMLTVTSIDSNNNIINVGITRTDQVDVTGIGEIAAFSFKYKDDQEESGVSFNVTTRGGIKSSGETVTVDGNIELVLESPITICEGDTATLSAGEGFDSYLWTSELLTTDIKTSTVDVTEAGDYTIEVSDSTGATASTTVTVVVNETPQVNLGNDISQSSEVELDAGSDYTSYLWSSDEISQTIIVSESGTYWVEVTNENGCSGSDTIVVTITTGIEGNLPNPLSVYPNPNNGNFWIDYEFESTENQQIELYNVEGRLVHKVDKKNQINHKYFIELKNIDQGVYYLKVSDGDKLGILRMVIQ